MHRGNEQGRDHGFGGHGKILGTTSVGERGQVIIPAEAREELDIKPGDKFLVFGNKRKGAVIMVKAEIFNKFAEFFLSKSKKFEKMAEVILGKTNAADLDEDEEIIEEEEK